MNQYPRLILALPENACFFPEKPSYHDLYGDGHDLFLLFDTFVINDKYAFAGRNLIFGLIYILWTFQLRR